MLYIFLAMIWLFAGLSSIFLFKNNFASETQQIIFPAIGAILLSGYLAYKIIYLEQPKITPLKTTVALFIDNKTGNFNPMVSWDKINQFDGLVILHSLLHSSPDVFAKLNLAQNVKQDINAKPASYETLYDVLEYAILKWLSESQNTVGYNETMKIPSIHGGYNRAFNNDAKTISTKIENAEGSKENPLLNTFPIMLNLPKGSKITRSSKKSVSEPPRKITINTTHSTINIEIVGVSSSGFRLSKNTIVISQVFDKILKYVNKPYSHGLYDDGWYELDDFWIIITPSQKSFYRFSDQSKLEAEWIEKLKDSFNKNFSWPHLYEAYSKN